MGKLLVIGGWVLLANLCMPALAAVDARRIIEEVYHQDSSRDTTYRAHMDVTNKKGVTRQKKFVFKKIGSLGNSKTLVRFTYPVEVQGVGLLTINQKGGPDRQWLYTPAIQRVRRVAPQEKSKRFHGTDFTHEDMAERPFDEFRYKLLSTSETVDGQAAYKIEIRPVAPEKSQYRYIHVWVARDKPVILHSDFYDDKDRKLRTMHADDIQRISNIWVARRLEMVSPLDGTKTLLVLDEVHFNQGLRNDLFTQQALEKGDAF
ncbi:MAG: outer membrane lipoprotein-sorting protein [Acidobacteria bacterium]|nr:outer membrane lipoprotein-sorting protein [Acidobacteriota bacterium]MBI3657530.1 outer membrane lipoprotein-sorting protein [Acidobacteriota bacterium]